MTNVERLALGTTYQEAFGGPSETIHYRSGADPVDHSRESPVVAEGHRLSTVAMCALRRVHELLGWPADQQLDGISQALNTNAEAARYLTALNRPEIAVGDFVAARDFLGQVIGECTSQQYGNRSLRVQLLDRLPAQNLSIVWFRAREVFPFLSKERVVAGIREKLGDPSATVDDQVLRDCARSAWKLREQLLA